MVLELKLVCQCGGVVTAIATVAMHHLGIFLNCSLNKMLRRLCSTSTSSQCMHITYALGIYVHATSLTMQSLTYTGWLSMPTESSTVEFPHHILLWYTGSIQREGVEEALEFLPPDGVTPTPSSQEISKLGCHYCLYNTIKNYSHKYRPNAL